MEINDTTPCASPDMLAMMGYSLAESGQFRKAIDLCVKAVTLNPGNSDYYLTLGRVYILAGERDKAITVFRKGLKIRKNADIMEELRRLGIRKPPPFNSLDRQHILNRVTGKLLGVLGMR